MVARRGVGGWGLRSWGVWGFDAIIILSIPATLLCKGGKLGGFFRACAFYNIHMRIIEALK